MEIYIVDRHIDISPLILEPAWNSCSNAFLQNRIYMGHDQSLRHDEVLYIWNPGYGKEWD